MRTLISALLVFSTSAFALEKGQQIQLASSCYANIEILRQMFRTGQAPQGCQARVVVRFSEPVQVVPGAVFSPDDLRSHLIGKLAHRASELTGEQQLNAVYNYFAITRIPNADQRGWAIRIFYKSVYPKLSEDNRALLNERLAFFWLRHTGNRDMLEILVAPIVLVMPSDQAAARLLALEGIANELSHEPPLGRSDIELRGLQTISNEWERVKRNDAAVQAALVHYLGRDKDLPDEVEPRDEFERQEFNKRRAVRAEAVKGLTNSVMKRNAYFKVRRNSAGLTAENVAKVVELLDANNPHVVAAALEVIAWQYAQEWVVTERAGEELVLAGKLAGLLKSPNALIRRATANAYSLMHPPQSVSQIALIGALSSPDEMIRAKASEALSLGTTYHNRRIVDPAVFKVVIQLALHGDERGRSDAAALLRQNLPTNLETITELVEIYGDLNSAIQPTIRDVLTSAAGRKMGLGMFGDNATEETRLRERLAAQLTSGVLADAPELRGLLTKKNLDLSTVFGLLMSEKPADVLEAAEILNKTRAELIRPLLNKHVEAPQKIRALALRLKETSSTPVGELLLEMLADEALVPTIGRNTELFAAVVNPSAAALGSPRAQTAYAKALKGLSESPARIHSSLKGSAAVNESLEARVKVESVGENILALLRCYDLTQKDPQAVRATLLPRFMAWMEDPKTQEARRKAVAMLRARAPLPEGAMWVGILALAYRNDPTPEMRRMIAEISVASYATVLPHVGDYEWFSPFLAELIQSPFAEPRELLDEAIRDLGMALDVSAVASEIDSNSPLARCANEINKAAAKKK